MNGPAEEDGPVATSAEETLLPLLRGQKQVFEQIARGEPLHVVLDALVRLLEGLISEEVRASILVLDEDGTRLLHGAAPSLPDHYNRAIHGTAIGPHVGSCGTAAHRGAPVIVTDIATDPLWVDFRDLALDCDLRACWSVPITASDGRVLGTFAVYASTPGEPAAQDWEAVAAFVQTAAVAIERHRDLETIIREKRVAEALDQVARAIAARTELEEIVQQATDAATVLTGAQVGAFFYNVIGDDGAAYQLYTLSGAPREAFERFPMPRATGIFAPTFAGDPPVRLADVTADPRFGRNPPYHGMPRGHLPVRSYLAVPVKTSDGEVAGALFFGHPEPGVFGPQHEQLAVGIAAHAAIAIENARLYTAARRAFEDRDRVARQLQESLLPPSVPVVPGLDIAADYHAAGEGVDVLGDFYDVFKHGPGRWSVVIGDVCGKGIAAAKTSALARHTVRAAAMHSDSPADVLHTLNEVTLAEGGGEIFLTALYADVDLSGPAPVVTLCSAGHPPALLRHRLGTVTEAETRGPLLGSFHDAELVEERHELAPGDALLLVTDGVIEARGSDGLFGEARLRRAFADAPDGDARAIVGAVTAAVTTYAGATLADDVAIVALRVPDGA
jgi:serine phosphatase RsbU (regulator of sigma subunit)